MQSIGGVGWRLSSLSSRRIPPPLIVDRVFLRRLPKKRPQRALSVTLVCSLPLCALLKSFRSPVRLDRFFSQVPAVSGLLDGRLDAPRSNPYDSLYPAISSFDVFW